jgi:uncharacterized protein YcaQ
MIRKFSKKDFRQLLMNYHNLNDRENISGIDGVRKILARIGSVQYDPLNVVGRNADLVLQARVKDYSPEILQKLLYTEHGLIDGFDKEMCIYNTEEYPKFSGIREAHTESTLRTLKGRNQLGAIDILEEVRNHIEKHGITGTRDISIGESKEGSWGHRKLSSAALDYLYNKGELCVANKKGTQKYFDFTEKVLKPQYCSEYDFKTIEDFYDWYVKRRIACIGAICDKRGGAWQGHYLSDNTIRKAALKRLVDRGEIEQFSVEGMKEFFYIKSDDIELLNLGENEETTKFIAPLDNILWDRNMVEKIFNFEYRWEVYTPVDKRKYGYYVIPVLYGNEFVARFEPNSFSEEKCFSIKNWWWEPSAIKTDKMLSSIEEAMFDFAKFLGTTCSPTNMELLRN